MHCPDCSNERTRVVDTAASDEEPSVRRRRECRQCAFRFTTYERPAWNTLQIEKRDGETEPFDRGKLRAGIERAVEKRGVSDATVTELVDDIESTLQSRETQIVASETVGELVADRLRDLDLVAYIRFVSVYEAFAEPEAFRRELDAILDAGTTSHESTTSDQ